MPIPYVAAIGAVVNVGTQIAQKVQQDRSSKAFASQNGISQGGPLEASLASGQQAIPHRLGRVPQGWSLVCRMANEQVWDYQAPDAENLYLETSGAVDVKLLVF